MSILLLLFAPCFVTASMDLKLSELFNPDCVVHVHNYAYNLSEVYRDTVQDLLNFHETMLRTVYTSSDKQVSPVNEIPEHCALHFLVVEDTKKNSRQILSHINGSNYKNKPRNQCIFIIPTIYKPNEMDPKLVAYYNHVRIFYIRKK